MSRSDLDRISFASSLTADFRGFQHQPREFHNLSYATCLCTALRSPHEHWTHGAWVPCRVIEVVPLQRLAYRLRRIRAAVDDPARCRRVHPEARSQRLRSQQAETSLRLRDHGAGWRSTVLPRLAESLSPLQVGQGERALPFASSDHAAARCWRGKRLRPPRRRPVSYPELLDRLGHHGLALPARSGASAISRQLPSTAIHWRPISRTRTS
jgi:hypothetical protein